MPDEVEELEVQLIQEMGRAILGPVGRVLGAEHADGLARAVRSRAAELARQLTDPDRSLATAAAEAIQDLVPDRPRAWWQTPLGQAVAAQVDPTRTVSQAEAGRILGLTRGRITQLVQSGQLATGPDGKPLLASVLARLVWTRQRFQSLRPWPDLKPWQRH
ncbi:hypothetical protein [Microlunatus speluncae]|uniref:hypothetical protein n=1 Tax=Microlunatus speluncae TaxID=2594267 RepID=UPI0012668502|nr:hypothetical protein [Microlunatus speluncae]